MIRKILSFYFNIMKLNYYVSKLDNERMKYREYVYTHNSFISLILYAIKYNKLKYTMPKYAKSFYKKYIRYMYNNHNLDNDECFNLCNIQNLMIKITKN